MAIEKLCPPAVIFLVFSIIQIALDSSNGYYNTAMLKAWVAVIFTILLNYLCNSGLGIVAWLFIFIPFLLMTVIISILLFVFGLDPSTGKMRDKQTRDGYELKKDSVKITGYGIPDTEVTVTQEVPEENDFEEDDNSITYYTSIPNYEKRKTKTTTGSTGARIQDAISGNKITNAEKGTSASEVTATKKQTVTGSDT